MQHLNFAFGPSAKLPAGYARCHAGTTLLRGHTPGRRPDWFGPAVGAAGIGRFDLPARVSAAEPGICYLAAELDGVLLERVLRGVWRPALALSTLRARHAVAPAVVTRDLILLDLVVTLSTVHGLEVNDISAPPPYTRTQQLAERWIAASHPVPVDGILYGSRFGPAALCVGLWEPARSALAWGPSTSLDADLAAFYEACGRLGLGLLP